MSESSSSTQLDRILYILPVAARQNGASVSELARALEVDGGTVLGELGQAVTRAYYHPAGSVEAFTVTIEHDRVRVHAPHDFQRPVRLNAREALALGLGLRALAAQWGTREAEVRRLAERLERELQAVTHELQPRVQQPDRETATASNTADGAAGPPIAIELAVDEHLGQLAEAIAQHRYCTISYLKPAAPRSADRRIAPLLLVYDRGQWYLAALDDEQKERRLFRLDRILSMRVENETFDRSAIDADLGLQARGFAYQGDQETEMDVWVRYSPRIARWLAEQVKSSCAADGTLTLKHSVADLDWLVRHVLQYGEEAEVLAPAEARERVRAFAQTLLEDPQSETSPFTTAIPQPDGSSVAPGP
jgi:predicted DNA-binding transcriptional regulator YafY